VYVAGTFVAKFQCLLFFLFLGSQASVRAWASEQIRERAERVLQGQPQQLASEPETMASSSKIVANANANANAVELPLLTKTNYHEWSLVMQVCLEAMELWDAVEAE